MKKALVIGLAIVIIPLLNYVGMSLADVINVLTDIGNQVLAAF